MNFFESEEIRNKVKPQFVKTFFEAYRDFYAQGVSLGSVKLDDLEISLEKIFQEEIDDCGSPGIHQIIVKDSTNQIIGYLAFKDWDEQRKISDKLANNLQEFPQESTYSLSFYFT